MSSARTASWNWQKHGQHVPHGYLAILSHTQTQKNNERVENTTWLPVVKRIAESLKLCQTGVDEYGDPLTPGGHRFTVWGITGDNEHHANFFGCPHWSMREWCAKCDCNKTTKDGLGESTQSTKWVTNLPRAL